jgi:Protein of unknown function (DUF789)
MFVLANYYARKLPWDRRPMYDELKHLKAEAPSSCLPIPSALFSTPLSNIHPCSWFAVWWQPLYRIPDMPLDVKFLTYYSFESVHRLFCNPPRRKQSYDIPVTGLLCGGVQAQSASAEGDEHWLRPRSEDGSVHSTGDLTQDPEAAFVMELNQLLKAAVQLTCDCRHDIVYLDKGGHEFEEDAHKDFAFLQRGRFGSLG